MGFGLWVMAQARERWRSVSSCTRQKPANGEVPPGNTRNFTVCKLYSNAVWKSVAAAVQENFS